MQEMIHQNKVIHIIIDSFNIPLIDISCQIFEQNYINYKMKTYLCTTLIKHERTYERVFLSLTLKKSNKTLKRLESSSHKFFRKCDFTLFDYFFLLLNVFIKLLLMVK